MINVDYMNFCEKQGLIEKPYMLVLTVVCVCVQSVSVVFNGYFERLSIVDDRWFSLIHKYLI